MCNESENRNARTWLACCATAAVTISLAFSNLDGYHNHFGQEHWHQEPPYINWAHGWPFRCLVRRSTCPPPGVPLNATHYPAPDDERLYSRWPFDSAPISRFSPIPLGIDLVVAAALILGSFWATRRLVDLLDISARFSLKSLFMLMALSGGFCAIAIPVLQNVRFRYITHFVAGIVLAAAAAATVLAVGDLLVLGIISLRRTRPR